jgi:hypothetical protein
MILPLLMFRHFTLKVLKAQAEDIQSSSSQDVQGQVFEV